MKSVKVLHVSPSFYPAHVYGGPVQSVYHLCRNLPQHGCEVRILTTNANGSDGILDIETGRESEISRAVSIVYCKRLLRHSVSAELVRMLPSRVRWADVVHLTGVYSFPTWPTFLTCKVFGKPLVWSPRGALQRWSGSTRLGQKAMWERVCRATAPRTLMLHVTSAEEGRESQLPFPQCPAVVVQNGVEMPPVVEHVHDPRELRLLYLGRLHPKKGIERLLQALALLQRAHGRRCSLTIAGSGETGYVRSISDQVAGLRLVERVRFVGEAVGQAKRELLLSSDVLVLPSHTENFGQVVVEALAYGLPVIASTSTPWRELVERGCGLWVDNEPNTLARTIDAISRMPLRQMGARGRKWMESEFSWERRGREMADLYSSLIKSSL